MVYLSPHRLKASIIEKGTAQPIIHNPTGFEVDKFVEYTVPPFGWRFLSGIVSHPRNLVKLGFWKATWVTLGDAVSEKHPRLGKLMWYPTSWGNFFY